MTNLNNKNDRNKVNISEHGKTAFQKMVDNAMLNGGIQLIAMKNFGKTRFLFSMADYLQSKADCRVLIFDGSEAWLYGYSGIPVFDVNEEDITVNHQKTAFDMEQFQLNNFEMVKFALRSYKDILFRLKSKNPSKRGYFIRTVINYLDDYQRKEKAVSAKHENSKKIAYFIEEFENCFNGRSTLRLDAETFLTTFNEARNFNEAFFTCSQRETDCSKTLRTKQLMAYGKIPESDKSAYHRRLEKEYNIDLSNMKPRTWLIEGKLITAPEWTQSGKPCIINRILREKYSAQAPAPKPNLMQRLRDWWDGKNYVAPTKKEIEESERLEQQAKEDAQEDSEGDGLMGEGDIMFPEEL
jgi:hypothetical protein